MTVPINHGVTMDALPQGWGVAGFRLFQGLQRSTALGSRPEFARAGRLFQSKRRFFKGFRNA